MNSTIEKQIKYKYLYKGKFCNVFTGGVWGNLESTNIVFESGETKIVLCLDLEYIN